MDGWIIVSAMNCALGDESTGPMLSMSRIPLLLQILDFGSSAGGRASSSLRLHVDAP